MKYIAALIGTTIGLGLGELIWSGRGWKETAALGIAFFCGWATNEIVGLKSEKGLMGERK